MHALNEISCSTFQCGLNFGLAHLLPTSTRPSDGGHGFHGQVVYPFGLCSPVLSELSMSNRIRLSILSAHVRTCRFTLLYTVAPPVLPVTRCHGSILRTYTCMYMHVHRGTFAVRLP